MLLLSRRWIAVGALLSGLGVGLGALFPRFNVNNAAKIATGFGGFFYMVVGVFLNLLVVVLSVLPTISLVRLIDGYAPWLVTAPRLALAVILALSALAIPLAVAALIVRFGAHRLDQSW